MLDKIEKKWVGGRMMCVRLKNGEWGWKGFGQLAHVMCHSC